jgi:arginyl-tRNA synthetase
MAIRSESTRASGPVEHALVRAILSRAPDVSTNGSGDADLEVEFLPNSNMGNFRMDLRPLLGEDALDRNAGTSIAHELRQLPLVDEAISVPPRVYLNVPVQCLYSLVLEAIQQQGDAYGCSKWGRETTAFVAFSDPNINKPLHLGHLRNNFLGMALAALLSGTGQSVERHSIHTDWGIHICQALLAYLKWGGGETPTSAGAKGDHFVGKYYVMFHAENERQRKRLEVPVDVAAPAAARTRSTDGAGQTPLEREAAEVLHRLGSGDTELRRLHDTIVRWADSGIRETYQRIGTRFDAVFYESQYLDQCNNVLARAIDRSQCLVRPDGSAFVDLSDLGLGHVTLRRRDGTPVVYTQWMAVDIERFGMRDFDELLVLLGSEWEAGFSILLETLKRFGEQWATRVEPLYYGMVTLPEGRMKSRRGTGLSGDGLLDRVRDRLLSDYHERTGADTHVLPEHFDILAVSLLKYHFLAGRRAKNFLYREEALWHNTLPRFVRILGLLQNVRGECEGGLDRTTPRLPAVVAPRATAVLRPALLKLNEFPRSVEQAIASRDPAVLIRFLDALALAAAPCRRKLSADDPLLRAVSSVLGVGLKLLNIDLPSPRPDLRLLLDSGVRS